MVGSLSVKDPNLIPPDFEEFISSSGGNGFIIVSFGSNVASLSPSSGSGHVSFSVWKT